MSGPLRGYLRRQACSASARQEIKGEAAELMRAGIAAAEVSRLQTSASSSSMRSPTRESFQHDLAELRRILGA